MAVGLNRGLRGLDGAKISKQKEIQNKERHLIQGYTPTLI